MTDITDPRAITFTNELRAVANTLRLLEAQAKSMAFQWTDGGVSLLIANDPEANLMDNREGEGISRLTGADIASWMGIVGAARVPLNAVGAQAILDKPCVGPVKGI